MRQVAQAISFIHQQGIVHRDIKPENVLLQDNGNIALCDFGISKDIISNKYESTMVMSAVGTTAYCAPEAGAFFKYFLNHCLPYSMGIYTQFLSAQVKCHMPLLVPSSAPHTLFALCVI